MLVLGQESPAAVILATCSSLGQGYVSCAHYVCILDMTNTGRCFLLLSLCGQSVVFCDQNLHSLLSGSVELSNLHGISGKKESMPFSAQAKARGEAQEHWESRRAHHAWNQSVLTDPPSLCLGSPVVSPHGNPLGGEMWLAVKKPSEQLRSSRKIYLSLCFCYEDKPQTAVVVWR